MILHSINTYVVTPRSNVTPVRECQPEGNLSSRSQEAVAAAAAALAALHEGGLVLEDGQGILEASDLRLSTTLALLVSLRLGNAAVLKLGVVLHNSGEFRILGVAVGGKLRNLLVQAGELLRLVLNILLVHCLLELVLLHVLVMGICCSGLFGLFLCEIVGEVCLHH